MAATIFRFTSHFHALKKRPKSQENKNHEFAPMGFEADAAAGVSSGALWVNAGASGWPIALLVSSRRMSSSLNANGFGYDIMWGAEGVWVIS